MLDIARFSDTYTVRRMCDGDVDAIRNLCMANTLFYEYSGRTPTRELILHDLHVTPPRTEVSAKYYVGFYDGETIVALLDLIEGYPDGTYCFVGFFMMNTAYQGREIGSHIINCLFAYLKEAGFRSVKLGIYRDNPQSNHFWKKNGFEITGEYTQDDGVILVAEKEL